MASLPAAKTIGSKHATAVNHRHTVWFTADFQGAPRVGFAQTQGGTLVLLQGSALLDRNDMEVRRLRRPATLRYTVKEWDAFIRGVKAGEFEHFASGATTDTIPVRDSKDPDGPVLAFTVSQVGPFLDAVRKGKYDL